MTLDARLCCSFQKVFCYRLFDSNKGLNFLKSTISNTVIYTIIKINFAAEVEYLHIAFTIAFAIGSISLPLVIPGRL